MSYREITSTQELHALLTTHERIERCAFQGMDFSEFTTEHATCRYYDCLFMGCTFSKQMRIQIDRSCLIFSHIDVPTIASSTNYTTPTPSTKDSTGTSLAAMLRVLTIRYTNTTSAKGKRPQTSKKHWHVHCTTMPSAMLYTTCSHTTKRSE